MTADLVHRPGWAALTLAALAACGAPAEVDPGPLPDAGSVNEAMCPPMGEVGVREGDVIPDVTLHDCAGNEVSLQELCGYKAAYFFVYADW